jgi:hypothetical protein
VILGVQSYGKKMRFPYQSTKKERIPLKTLRAHARRDKNEQGKNWVKEGHG